MKRILAILMAAAMVFCLAACGSGTETAVSAVSEVESAVASAAENTSSTGTGSFAAGSPPPPEAWL